MKTARMERVNWGTDSSSSSIASATTEEIDSYAQSVLEEQASSAPDDSLGAYVTSVMRVAHNEGGSLEETEEFDGLIELLEEHCGMVRSVAKRTLHKISEAVTSRSIPNTKAALHTVHSLVTRLPSEEDNGNNCRTPTVVSPLHADNLLPINLLEEDNAAAGSDLDVPEFAASQDDHFPPLSAAQPSKNPLHRKAIRTSAKKGTLHSQEAAEIAASLFRPSRSRQSSIDETSPVISQTSEKAATSPLAAVEENALPMSAVAYNTAELLLSMNIELSEDAAVQATTTADGDINFAQYLIDCAVAAPPVCRHLLNAGCYRSDCQYSHDIEGHTCIFWLRGRCGKGSSCRFLHGFNPQVLQDVLSGENTIDASDNVESFSYVPSSTNSSSGSPAQQSYGAAARGFDSNTISWAPLASAGGSSSFANIASQGYRSSSFAKSQVQEPTTAIVSTSASPGGPIGIVRIPQDLWNPHENRDSAFFFIADPLERYKRVSASVRREDVIDLHFQSSKTFPTVLSTILPEKLRSLEEVWIVTGTGHHVGSKTHQKGGGVLETAVISWLTDEGYKFRKGRDRNGLGGAVLVSRF